MGTSPSLSMPIFSASISMQITLFPISARQVPLTKPTYPVPIIPTVFSFEAIFFPFSSVLDLPCGKPISYARIFMGAATMFPGDVDPLAVYTCLKETASSIMVFSSSEFCSELLIQ